jgi:hypothetical protein
MVGLGADLSDAQFGAALRPGVAAVVAAVVGQDPFGGDATFGEPGHSSVEERDEVDGVLDADELDAGEPGVGVDDGVDVAATQAGPVVGRCMATLLVFAAGRDAGQFLDVDVDQFAATAGLDSSDHPPAGVVHPLETVNTVTNQNPVGRHCWHLDDPWQACRARHG